MGKNDIVIPSENRTSPTDKKKESYHRSKTELDTILLFFIVTICNFSTELSGVWCISQHRIIL